MIFAVEQIFLISTNVANKLITFALLIVVTNLYLICLSTIFFLNVLQNQTDVVKIILIQINLNYGNNGTRQQMSFVIITMRRTKYLKECKEVV